MSGKYQRGESVLSPTKPHTAIWLRLALILAVLVIASFPLVLNGSTIAKYAAEGTVYAGAQVAKWDVNVESTDVPVEPIDLTPDNIPYDVTREEHPLLLFFQGAEGNSATPSSVFGNASLTMTLVNDSEVAARFTPKAMAQAGTPIVEFYKDAAYSQQIQTTGSTAGVELPPGGSMLVYVVIKNSTFTNLKLGAYCEQID